MRDTEKKSQGARKGFQYHVRLVGSLPFDVFAFSTVDRTGAETEQAWSAAQAPSWSWTLLNLRGKGWYGASGHSVQCPTLVDFRSS